MDLLRLLSRRAKQRIGLRASIRQRVDAFFEEFFQCLNKRFGDDDYCADFASLCRVVLVLASLINELADKGCRHAVDADVALSVVLIQLDVVQHEFLATYRVRIVDGNAAAPVVFARLVVVTAVQVDAAVPAGVRVVVSLGQLAVLVLIMHLRQAAQLVADHDALGEAECTRAAFKLFSSDDLLESIKASKLSAALYFCIICLVPAFDRRNCKSCPLPASSLLIDFFMR